ncbi:two-component system sensor histidine kinase NtrB [Archangium lipolyticum]|uniref:two-component system sensor histidine kinase NtrB n=1 Tax=Archangium lipolyticum TaxID=2970465 RepID=UPI00214A76A2|nr:ATP-binding protein [Archangium lipolyticum]
MHARSRVMTAATCILTLLTLLFLLVTPHSAASISIGSVMVLFYLGTLVVIRRATSLSPPATLLCLGMSAAFIAGAFSLGGATYASTHAVHMMLAALSVYLLGPRRGLFITLLLILGVGLLRPLHHVEVSLGGSSPPDPFYWPMHILASFCLLGGWALSSLNGTERDEAQAKLERTIDELRDSEGKLSSVFESTDDMMSSIDLQGRLLTANPALREMYRKRYGRDLVLGQPLAVPMSPENVQFWEQRIAQAFSGQHMRFEETYRAGPEHYVMDIRLSPIRGAGGRITGVTIVSRDITARKEAESRMGEMHRTLMDVSRQAGMAELATGVLHNVGNTLNSVNVSTGVLADQLRKSHVAGLAKATSLMREHATELGTFLTTDPQGQKLPAYLFALSQQLQEERDAMSQEVRSLSQSIEHIKSIIGMQQKNARVAGSQEQLSIPQLIDEALRLHAISFERLGIAIERDYAQVAPILVDRHKLLQILVNLLSNARQALLDSGQRDKRLTIRVQPSPEGRNLLIQVADNGQGIAPEHLPRMFTLGFTTKKTGHGFGLHISALTATEMKGRLTCTSPGPGQGATFTLELPVEGAETGSTGG